MHFQPTLNLSTNIFSAPSHFFTQCIFSPLSIFSTRCIFTESFSAPSLVGFLLMLALLLPPTSRRRCNRLNHIFSFFPVLGVILLWSRRRLGSPAHTSNWAQRGKSGPPASGWASTNSGGPRFIPGPSLKRSGPSCRRRWASARRSGRCRSTCKPRSRTGTSPRASRGAPA